jgi:hypothetical protein
MFRTFRTFKSCRRSAWESLQWFSGGGYGAMLPESIALHDGEIQDYLAADIIDLLCGQPRVRPRV